MSLPRLECALIAWSLAFVACAQEPHTKEQQPKEQRERKPQERKPPAASERVLFSGATASKPLCSGIEVATLGTSLSVQSWISEKVDSRQLASYTRPLEETFSHYGVRFISHGEASSIQQDPIIASGPDSASLASDTRALRALIEHMQEGPDLHLIFVDRILSDTHAMGTVLTQAAGVTISPHIQDPDDREVLAQLIGRPLDELTAPLILLSQHELETIEPQRRFDVLAHEVGHALGLPHAGGRERLMSQIRHSHCVPGFTAEELAHLRTVLGRAPAP